MTVISKERLMKKKMNGFLMAAQISVNEKALRHK